VYNLTLLWVIIRAAVWQPKSPVYQRTSSKKPERVPAKPTV
jgi:hypothetical protein